MVISLLLFKRVPILKAQDYSLSGISEPGVFCRIFSVLVTFVTFKAHLLANTLLEANDLILSSCMCAFAVCICLWVPMVTWHLTCRAVRFHGFSYSPSRRYPTR